MLTLPIFEPAWACVVRGVEHCGSGLLAKELWEDADAIESFKVFTPSFSVTVLPKLGQVLTDSAVAIQAVNPGKLVWFRRMEFDVNTHDTNLRSPVRCAFYGIGLDLGLTKVGCRLREDGTLIAGLD